MSKEEEDEKEKERDLSLLRADKEKSFHLVSNETCSVPNAESKSRQTGTERRDGAAATY